LAIVLLKIRTNSGGARVDQVERAVAQHPLVRQHRPSDTFLGPCPSPWCGSFAKEDDEVVIDADGKRVR